MRFIEFTDCQYNTILYNQHLYNDTIKHVVVVQPYNRGAKKEEIKWSRTGIRAKISLELMFNYLKYKIIVKLFVC